MCVHQEKRIGITIKPVADRKANFFEEHVCNLKICAHVEEIEQNVSKLNQKVESLVNSTTDTSEVSSIFKNRKKTLSQDYEENESDASTSDDKEDDLVYDIG